MRIRRLQDSTGIQALMLFFRCAQSEPAGPGSISKPLTSMLRTSHHQAGMFAMQLPVSESCFSRCHSGARNLILGAGPHDIFTDCLDSNSRDREFHLAAALGRVSSRSQTQTTLTAMCTDWGRKKASIKQTWSSKFTTCTCRGPNIPMTLQSSSLITGTDGPLSATRHLGIC